MTVAQYEREMRYRQLCELLYTRQDSKCPVCKKLLGGGRLEIHHARCADSEVAAKRWPHCVEHPDNKMLLHGDCHREHGSFGRWSERQLDEWEAQLRAAKEHGN